MTALEKQLSELMRPRQLAELTLAQRDIQKLQQMYNSGDVVSMLFHGPPGSGKTSAGRIFALPKVPFEGRTLEPARDRPASFIKKISDFATGGSLICFLPGNGEMHDMKICFIDEADHLSGNA